MKKKHQHFIPQTYLRKFAHTHTGNKHFISAFNKQNNHPRSNISVKDICVETDLYTLKHLQGEEKYKIENFFSDNIETKYPNIYNLLVKEKKKYISIEERTYILYTTLSMYFRTPKALNNFVAFLAKLVTQVQEESNSDIIDFLGFEVSTKEKSFEQIKKDIKEHQRINFIQTQFALLDQLARFKALDGLSVIELVGDQEFITSDNPVEIGNSFETGFNLFDAGNAIYVPLDPKHALFIAPREEDSIVNQVFYKRDNFFHHAALNHRVYENAERWVMGTKVGITNFLKDKEEYSKPASENHPIIVKLKEKMELMQKLSKLADKGITNDNLELVEFLRNLKKNKLFDESIEFQDAYNQLKEMGLRI